MKLKPILSILLVIIFIIGWFMFLRPVTMGGPANYIIIAGNSMEPTYHTGDFVFTLKRASYDIGDIVSFRVKDSIVIHRITGGNATEGFTIQGDNKAYPDSWHPTGDQILGSALLYIPNFGEYLLYLRNPYIFAGVIGAMYSILFIPWLINVLKRDQRRNRKRDILLSRRREQELTRYMPPNFARKLIRLNNL
jgi:signal peptidase